MGNVRVTVVNRIQNDLGEIARYACGMFVILSVLIDAEKPEIAFPGPGVLDPGRSLALCSLFCFCGCSVACCFRLPQL